MAGRRKVVMIGLDACDPALAQRFAAEGIMPNLARLMETGARAPVKNPFGLFVGSLWVNFGTAQRPDRHRFHCWDQIDPETYEYRLNSPSIAHIPPFWDQIEGAGRRVAVVDAPHMIAARPVAGARVFEWGCHDKHHGFHSQPPELARRIAADFGLHPALKGEGDAYAALDTAPDDWVHRAGLYRTREEEAALLRDMLAGAQAKTRLLASLMGEADWDLFVGVFGESHAIGHQQWHLHDPRHPRHDAQTVAALGGDPLAQVYGALDRAVGELEALVPDEALLLVHLSHGMGPHYDGDHLLEEILARLDRHGRGVPAEAAPRRPARVPEALRGVSATVPRPLRAWFRSTFLKTPGAAELRARQRFFKEPNNTVHGGVRLNLAGREPRGIVQPGEVEGLIAEITEGLLELRNADNGKPVIRSVERSETWHRRTPDDTMPDLFLEWARHGLVETVTSPRIGSVHRRYGHWRTGDHQPAGLLVARGPGMAQGERMPGLAVEDIGPSIAAAMGVELSDVDGTAAGWIAEAARAT